MAGAQAKPGTFPFFTYFHLLYFVLLLLLEFNWINFVLGSCPYEKIVIGITNDLRREFPLVLGLMYMIATSRFIRIPTGWGLQTLPRYEMPNSLLYVSAGSIFLSFYRIMANMHIGLSKSEATAFFFMVYTQLTIWITTRGLFVNPRFPWMVSILGNLASVLEEVVYDTSGDGKFFVGLLMTVGVYGCFRFIEDFQKSNKFEVTLIQRTDPAKYRKIRSRIPTSYLLDASGVSLAVMSARTEALPLWTQTVFELFGNMVMIFFLTMIMLEKNAPNSCILVEAEAGQQQASTAPEHSTAGVSPESEKGNVLQQGLDDGNNAENKAG